MSIESVNLDFEKDYSYTTTLERLEQCLLPAPQTIYWNQGVLTIEEYTTTQKIAYFAKNLFIGCILLPSFLLTIPVDCLLSLLAQKQITPPPQFSDIELSPPAWPPEQRGFATSFFQTSGLGTKWSATPGLEGKCDWDKWMDAPKHVIHSDGFDYKNFFADVLTDPTAYIEMLKAQNVTAHRFSLEWSVIEPECGKIDMKAVALYQNFIQKLLDAGITPSVTLSHFVMPEWFYERGNFQKTENIDLYVNFALKAMELFPNVKDWWSFNELGVKALQQNVREVYPTDLPEGSFAPKRFYAAGISTRNMLIAHCLLHKEATRLHPDKKVGVTHQWLKFDTEQGNFLERLVAYYTMKIAFTPVYQFFKKGHYSFQFPFMANIHFKIPKEEFDANDHFLMRLGVQAYPKPMLKMGLNYGYTYPGPASAIKNFPLFSFGGTCEPGGTLMRFGPRWKAEGMDEILDEAFSLTDQVYITEYGSDSKIQKWGSPEFQFDDAAQAAYLKQLTERIRDYSARNFREIKGIFCWSDLRSQLEWENGFDCRLATIEPVLDENRHLTGWTPTPASEYIAEVYK